MSTPNSEKPQTTVSARRRLLQIVAVGGTAAIALPEKWVKPVVDAVMVPAHAATSVVPISGIFGNQGALSTASGQGNFLERVADMLIGSAHANGLPICGVDGSYPCIRFVIGISPDRSVTVFVGNATTSVPARIESDNTIGTITCSGLVFTNLIANGYSLRGFCTDPTTAFCHSGEFTLLRRTSNACST
jgi:hypothetical protein